MRRKATGQGRRSGLPGIVLVALATASGCSTFVPGSNISSTNPWFGPPAQERESEGAATLPDMVRVQAIVPGISALGQEAEAAAPSLPPDLLQAPDHYEYRVGPGDVLTITVWDHPELTIPAGSERMATEAGNWVHDDGTIYYPYVGVLKVAGLRPSDIRKLLIERLAKYIENPQVDVTVAAFRSQRVYVAGEVKTPGTFPITNVPMRVVDAVNQAGGLDERADWRNLILTRDGKEYPLSLRAVYERGDPRFNVLLRAGDVVHVGRDDDSKIFVMGEVAKPDALPMGRNGMTLAEALAKTGGINELHANASGIFVMRRADEGGKPYIDLYQLDAKEATALVLADGFALRSRDIVYVTAAPVARWNRVIQLLLPTAQGIFFGASTKNDLQN